MPVKISVITPSFNASRYIAETIQSVMDQTFQDWEMIIIDDCSEDNSREIIRAYAGQDSRIKLVCMNKNGGAGEARNKGIELATGRFIAFLDSDDLWEPRKLEKQLSFMLKNKLAFSYTAYYKIDAEGRRSGEIGAPPEVTYLDLLKTCSIGCLTVMYDSFALGKVLMPTIRKRQDYALWLKILKETKRGYGINQYLASYRVRRDSISANKIKAALFQWKVYRNVENLPMLSSAYYFLHYMFNGIIKTYIR